jgi:hypothetical protein
MQKNLSFFLANPKLVVALLGYVQKRILLKPLRMCNLGGEEEVT